MDDNDGDLHDLEKRHAAVMVAVRDMRDRIDRQKNRVAIEIVAYRTLEKQAISLYDAESDLSDEINRLKSGRSQD